MREELTTHVIAEPARTQILTRLAHLDKIVTDEVRLTTDEAGAVLTVTELDKDDQGSFRLGSATDPDATYRIHGEKKSDFGYNVAVNDQFVREINAVTGAQPDSTGVPALITEQIEHHEVQPEKFIYDAAAGTGKARAVFQAATGGRTQLVAPIPASALGKNPTRFTPEAFTLSEDGTTLTCPNGHTTEVAFRHGTGDGRSFRFTSCADCPLIKQCRDPQTDPTHMRQVFISDYRDLLKDAKTYNLSEVGKADLKHRPLVERVIANLVRYHDARQARRRGLVNADYQAKKAGTAFNLRQWVRARLKRAEDARLAEASREPDQTPAGRPNEKLEQAALSSARPPRLPGPRSSPSARDLQPVGPTTYREFCNTLLTGIHVFATRGLAGRRKIR